MSVPRMFRRVRPWALRLLTACAGVSCGLAQAQTLYEVQAPQRLSSWLGAQAPALVGSESLALFWTTPEERQQQAVQRSADVAWLRHALLHPQDSVMWQWLQSTPVTGRMPLTGPVQAWLEGVPSRDPLLRPGDGVWTVPVGQPVRVIDGAGQGCALRHQPGAWLPDYLAACEGLDPASVQRAWVVQPDGRARAYPLQPWQPVPQTQLAPGAVVWLGWPRHLLQPDVKAQELEDIDRRTALWLAAALPPDLPAVRTVSHAPVGHRGDGVSDADVSGLRGARFAPVPSSSHWGVVGLMQTPTARMRPAGSFSVSAVNTWPQTWLNVVMQPLDWLEGGFRYVSVANRLYGPAEFSGSQSYKDKSFEVKARLLREGDRLPELAVGIRDLGGTGFYGGEYLVASKRWGRWDASLGLGWGYVGARGNWPNPLGGLSEGFRNREAARIGQGGTLSTGSYFTGRTAPFGGVEYQSPWGPVFKVEYNGNDYRHEPQGNHQPVHSPLNYGLVYRWWPGVDLHLSWERGHRLGLGLSLWTDLSGLSMPKVSDKPLPPVQLAYPQGTPDWQRTRADIEQYTQWQVRRLLQDGPTLAVEVTDSQDTYVQPRLERVMRLAQRDAPADIQQIEVRHWAAGDVLAVDRMDRQRWLRSLTEPPRSTQPQALSEREWPPAHAFTHASAHATQEAQTPQVLPTGAARPWRLMPGVGFRQSLGGPDAFMLYKLSLTLAGEARLPGDWRLVGQAEWRALSNYDRFQFRGFGTDLPRVRTYLREYETQSRLTLPRLYAVRSARLSDSVTAAVYGGLLESMYGGAGGEMLYRPRGSDLALGVDLNRVRQRDFGQDFQMRDYTVHTGHLTAYWQTPWQGVLANVSVGQYLAGDRGVTLQLSRVFDNGVTMGAFATKTNISAAQFGEGSFNKGVFWSIPFDAFMPSSSRLRAHFNWVPLTRDGGALLSRPYHLYHETGPLGRQATRFGPAPSRQYIPDDAP